MISPLVIDASLAAAFLLREHDGAQFNATPKLKLVWIS